MGYELQGGRLDRRTRHPVVPASGVGAASGFLGFAVGKFHYLRAVQTLGDPLNAAPSSLNQLTLPDLWQQQAVTALRDGAISDTLPSRSCTRRGHRPSPSSRASVTSKASASSTGWC